MSEKADSTRTYPVFGCERADHIALQAERDRYKAALETVEPIQQRVLAMMRREGFVFETPLHLSEGWEKLAFTLYSEICGIDAEVRHALDPDYLERSQNGSGG